MSSLSYDTCQMFLMWIDLKCSTQLSMKISIPSSKSRFVPPVWQIITSGREQSQLLRTLAIWYITVHTFFSQLSLTEVVRSSRWKSFRVCSIESLATSNNECRLAASQNVACFSSPTADYGKGLLVPRVSFTSKTCRRSQWLKIM